MNTKRLLVVFIVLGTVCLALGSRSTLKPDRAGDHVFYGADVGHFISQEIAIGNFNGDEFDDILTTIKWDDPECGGYPFLRNNPTETICNTFGWTKFLAEKDDSIVAVCRFPDPDADAEHWSYWACLGWDSISGSAASCDTCYTAQFRAEDQGAAYVFLGGDWSGKAHDINLANGGADHMILGRVPVSGMYNAVAAGDMDGDGRAELVLGAREAGGAGEVYVIQGSNAWPDTIDLADPDDFDTWVVHYLIGRDTPDEFGFGVAMGDLNDDAKAELIVAAPGVDSEKGAVYVFYAGASLPDTVDLSELTDNQIASYGQVIYGAAQGDRLGVTTIGPNLHPPHHGRPAHDVGFYSPVGLAIGNWNSEGEDNPNDLVLGAGEATSGAGRAYVVFGGGSPTKLTPGNTIYLDNAPGGSSNACDIKIVGASSSALGAGVAIVDADGGEGGDDLLIGAPMASGDGKTERGEVFIIFGAPRDTLTSEGGGVRNVTTPDHTDAVIFGEASDIQLGGHFAGGTRLRDFDIDDDGQNDIGIAGQRNMTVIFGQSGAEWESEIDLATAIEDQPKMRILRFEPQEYARSTTIRLADLDGDVHHDLVFGGYDSPGYPGGDAGAEHAGQMWVTKGKDFFKSGTLTASEAWSGVVFVDGDLTVPAGQTLTIAAGTDVWIWPTDRLTNGHVVDTIRVEIHVYGKLDVQGTLSNPVRFRAWGVDESTPNLDNKWYGIFIWESDSTSTISNCVIQNATRAIQCRGPATITSVSIADCSTRGVSVAGDQADEVAMTNVNVDGSEIAFRIVDDATASMTNCIATGSDMYGIRIGSGADVTVTGGSFQSNDIGAYVSCDSLCPTSAVFDGAAFSEACSVAVHIQGSVTGGIEDCTIAAITDALVLDNVGTGFSVTGTNILGSEENGITCDGCDTPMSDNTVQACDVAIYCDNEAAPVIRDSSIKLNLIGVVALNDANPDLGQGCSAACDPGGCASEGGNSFKTNTQHIANFSSGITVMAECNYFKKDSAAYFSGLIDRTPSRTSDPLPVSPFAGVALPDHYALGHNFPNPFNPVTNVKYQVPPPGDDVLIRIYDVSGRLVRTLVSDRKPPGYYEVQWTGVNDRGAPVASGIYFLQMKTTGFVESRKLVLLK